MVSPKVGDPGYGTKNPPETPKKPNPRDLPNKPNWKDWMHPNRWKDVPQPQIRPPAT